MTTIKSDQLTVGISSLGAELQSILGSDGTEYLWQGDPAYWPRRSPVLFPIVAALPGNSFTHGGKSYALGNHGFARDKEFKLVSSNASEAYFELTADDETRKSYPFDFVLGLGYKVKGSQLEVSYTVKNPGKETLVFSVGAHPAFRAPIAAGEKRSDYELVFEKPETVQRWRIDSNNLRTGERRDLLKSSATLPLTDDLFEDGALVLTDHHSRKLRLQSKSSKRFVQLSFASFPQLGIWSPKKLADGSVPPFVCMEPWYGVGSLANASPELTTKDATLSLKAGASFSAAFQIEVG